MKNFYIVHDVEVWIRLDSKKHGTQWTVIDLEDLGKVAREIKGKICVKLNKYNLYAYYGNTKYLHQLVLDFPNGIVDHRSIIETLDNRKSNLRSASTSASGYHRRKNTRNSSGYIGVSWLKNAQKWEVYLNIEKKHRRLGLFPKNNILGAATYRDINALEICEEYAVLNFPERIDDYQALIGGTI